MMVRMVVVAVVGYYGVVNLVEVVTVFVLGGYFICVGVLRC